MCDRDVRSVGRGFPRASWRFVGSPVVMESYRRCSFGRLSLVSIDRLLPLRSRTRKRNAGFRFAQQAAPQLVGGEPAGFGVSECAGGNGKPKRGSRRRGRRNLKKSARSEAGGKGAAGTADHPRSCGAGHPLPIVTATASPSSILSHRPNGNTRTRRCCDFTRKSPLCETVNPSVAIELRNRRPLAAKRRIFPSTSPAKGVQIGRHCPSGRFGKEE
jgi:hypothetical protein